MIAFPLRRYAKFATMPPEHTTAGTKMKTILINALKFTVTDWREKLMSSLAGIHPKVQDAMDAETAMREGALKNWDASFQCAITPRISAGTIFLDEAGSKFILSANNGEKYWVNLV